jgi:alcohol dehydrogenase class IV
MITKFEIPTKIFFGSNSINFLNPNAGRVGLIASSGIPDALLNSLIQKWSSNGIRVSIIKKNHGEPQSSVIDEVASNLTSGISGLVGIGGGSVMDFTKAIALVVGSGGNITDYEFGEREIGNVLPLYLAPTTCGSGSEVTPYTVINNSSTGRKFTISHPLLRPVQATIDPDLLTTLPFKVRLTTGLDAFVHCLEAVLTRTDTPLVSPLAMVGLSIGWKKLPALKNQCSTADTLYQLARMSVLGGLCIAHSRTGLVHTLSVALSRYFDLPHGLLNAYLLPFVLKNNITAYNGLLGKIMSTIIGNEKLRDEDVLEKITDWSKKLLDKRMPFSSELIINHEAEIIARVLQDKGLQTVSHGPVNEISLKNMLGNIAYATRCS